MTKFSVLDLIEQLSGIVNSNPEIDFSEVGVSLAMGEYSCNNVSLENCDAYSNNTPCVDLF